MERSTERCTITLVLAQPHYCKIETPKGLGRLFHLSKGHSADGTGIGGHVGLHKGRDETEESKIRGLRDNVAGASESQDKVNEKYAKLREFQSKGVPLDSLTRRLRSHPSLESLSIVRWLEGILEKEIDKESQSLKQLLLGYRERLNEDIQKKQESNWLQRLVRGISGVKERGDGVVALETSDGQITELGVAVLNAVLKSFLERVNTLNSSSIEDKRSAFVGNTVNVPGYLILSNDLKGQSVAPTPWMNQMGLQDSSRVNMLPPVKINLNENKNSSEPLAPMLRDPPRSPPRDAPIATKGHGSFPKGLKQTRKDDIRDVPWKSYVRSRYSKCSTSGPTKKQSRKMLMVENSFPPPILKDGTQRPYFGDNKISIQRRGGSNFTSYLYPVKSNFRQKMTNAINPFKLLYDIRSRVNPIKADNSLKVERVNKNEGKPSESKKIKPSLRLDVKGRRRRSDVTVKTQGAGITLELKEFLNTAVTGSANSKDEVKHNGEDMLAEDADSTAPRVALALPKNLLMDTSTPFNPPFKVNRYHCHKFIPPCARYAAIHTQRRHQRLRSGTPEYAQRPKNSVQSSELVNFLLMLHGNNSGTVKNNSYDEDNYYDEDEAYDEDENVDDDEDESDISNPLQEVQSQRICTNCDMGPCGCRKTSPLPCASSSPSPLPCGSSSSSTSPCGSSSSSPSPCGSSSPSGSCSTSPSLCGYTSSSVKPCFESKNESTGGSKKDDSNIEELTKSHFSKTEAEERANEITTHDPLKALENSIEPPEKGEISKQNDDGKHSDATTSVSEVKCNMCSPSQSCSCSSCSSESNKSTKCPSPTSTCPTKPCPNTCPSRPHTCSHTSTTTPRHNQMPNCSPSSTCPTPVPTQPCTTPARSTYTCPPSKCTTCPSTTCEPVSQLHEQITMIPRPAVTPPSPPDCFETAAVKVGKSKNMSNESEITTQHSHKDIDYSDIARKRTGSRRKLKLMAKYNNDPDFKNRFKLIPVRRMKQGKLRFDEEFEGKPLNLRRVGLHSRRTKMKKDRVKEVERAGLLGIMPGSAKNGLWQYVPYRLIHIKDVEKPLEIKRGIIRDVDTVHKTRSGPSINIIGPLKTNTLQRILGTDDTETNQFQEAVATNEEGKEDYEDEYENYLEEPDLNDNP